MMQFKFKKNEEIEVILEFSKLFIESDTISSKCFWIKLTQDIMADLASYSDLRERENMRISKKKNQQVLLMS